MRWLAVWVALAALWGCSAPDEQAQSARQEAHRALALGQRARALEALEELRQALPDSADAVAERALLLVHAGEAAQAVWLLDEAISRFPERPDLRLALARAALLVNDPSRARRAVFTIEAGSELHPTALVLQARAELGLGDLDRALATLERAEALYPDFAGARLARIAALSTERRFEEAAPLIEQVRSLIDSDEGLALLERFEVAALVADATPGESDAAIAALRARVEKDPAQLIVWSTLVPLLIPGKLQL